MLHENLTIFKFEPKIPNMSQLVGKRRNRVTKRTQHGCTQQCCDMLRCKSCDRLAVTLLFAIV